jgi:hypothetical protein
MSEAILEIITEKLQEYELLLKPCGHCGRKPKILYNINWDTGDTTFVIDHGKNKNYIGCKHTTFTVSGEMLRYTKSKTVLITCIFEKLVKHWNGGV